VSFGFKLKKVKDFIGDIKKAVINNLDKLKKQDVAATKDANENQVASEDVEKKFYSFKDSISKCGVMLIIDKNKDFSN